MNQPRTTSRRWRIARTVAFLPIVILALLPSCNRTITTDAGLCHVASEGAMRSGVVRCETVWPLSTAFPVVNDDYTLQPVLLGGFRPIDLDELVSRLKEPSDTIRRMEMRQIWVLSVDPLICALGPTVMPCDPRIIPGSTRGYYFLSEQNRERFINDYEQMNDLPFNFVGDYLPRDYVVVAVWQVHEGGDVELLHDAPECIWEVLEDRPWEASWEQTSR